MLAPERSLGEPESRALVRQLDRSSCARHRPRRLDRAALQLFRAAAQRRQAASPWPRTKAKHIVHLEQLTGAGWMRPNRHSSLAANYRPRFGYIINVDQLLREPESGGRDEYDGNAIRAIGIPVISGAPPIVIITPAQRERHPLEAASHHRVR